MRMELADGVPKSCVLGAVLFNTFINSLKKDRLLKWNGPIITKKSWQVSESKGWPQIYQIIFEDGEAE